MNFKITSTFVFLSFLYFPLFAQNKPIKKDTSSLYQLLRKGQFSGKVRSYAMATDNADRLTDNYAIALGGGINYATPLLWKHWRFEIGGTFIYNLVSSDLGAADSSTQVKDRYEIGLFDLENPQNISNLDRMNEFNAQFHFLKKTSLTLGRQVIKTPLINPQDGRMRPSLMSGIWFNSQYFKNVAIQGGWLWAAAPRSTVRWFSVGESIGVYANGVNTDGSKGNYFMNLESKGVFVLGLNSTISKRMKASFWNYLIENIQNSAFLQLDYTIPIQNSKNKINLAAQTIRQTALNNGGNANAKLTYLPKGEKSLILGAKIAYQTPKNEFSIQYTRITKEGRFIFPREWGRDPLFTFMQRERNEGAGDVHAATATYSTKAIHKRFQPNIGVGFYKMPDVKNTALNKYGLPSYIQLNVSFHYDFNGFFENMSLDALIAHKWNQGNTYNNDRYRINKVDMTNYNLVLNYGF